jgi:hypothetical protein
VTASDGGLGAALMQLAAQAGEIARIDGREADHWVQISGRLRELAGQVSGLADTSSEQGSVLAGLDATVADVDERLRALAGEETEPPGKGYSPIPAPRWWLADDDPHDTWWRREEGGKAASVARLQAWVGRVYLPAAGKAGAGLGACWPEHQFCLYVLDWFSELWSVLYLQPSRSAGTLAGQAEWWTRLLPAVAAMLAKETASCQQHAKALNGVLR